MIADPCPRCTHQCRPSSLSDHHAFSAATITLQNAIYRWASKDDPETRHDVRTANLRLTLAGKRIAQGEGRLFLCAEDEHVA